MKSLHATSGNKLLVCKIIFVYISAPMRQSIVRFFLLYTFLLSAFSQLDVRAGHDEIHHASPELSERTEGTTVGNSQLIASLLYDTPSSDKKHEVLKIDVTEVKEEEENEDEHDLISFRKHLDSHRYFISAFHALTSGYFSGGDNRLSPVYKHSSYTASCRYLVLLVFRI